MPGRHQGTNALFHDTVACLVEAGDLLDRKNSVNFAVLRPIRERALALVWKIDKLLGTPGKTASESLESLSSQVRSGEVRPEDVDDAYRSSSRFFDVVAEKLTEPKR